MSTTPNPISRELLIQCLESVSPGLSQKETVEQSSCFVFQNGEVMTFNDELACRKSVKGLNITGAVHAETLLQILQKLTDDEIEIKLNDEGTEVIVNGARCECGVTSEKEVTLQIGAVETPKKWSKLDEGFMQALDIAYQCASNDDSNFKFTCVRLAPEYIEACDNVQLSRVLVSTGVKEPFLIRKKSAQHLIQLAVNEMSETESWVHFRHESSGMIISCRRYLIDDYPDLSPLLEFDGVKVNLPAGIAGAADRASVFVPATSDSSNVRVTLKAVGEGKGLLVLSARGPTGYFKEKKRVTYDGPRISFLVSPELLINLMKGEKVREVEISENRLRSVKGTWTYITFLEAADEKKPEEKKK